MMDGSFKIKQQKQRMTYSKSSKRENDVLKIQQQRENDVLKIQQQTENDVLKIKQQTE